MPDPIDPAIETPIASEPSPTPTPAPASLTLGQRLTAAGNALAAKGTNADLVAARAQIAALTTERDSLVTSLAASTTELVAARAELATAQTAVTDFEARVIAASVEQCAAAGIPTAQLPISGNGGEGRPGTRAELEARMKGKPLQECIAMLREFNAASQN